MGENPFKNKEKLAIKVEIATEKDWEDYKRIRSEAIDTDPEVFGKHFKHEALEERNRSDQEWKDDLKNSIIVLSKNDSRVIGVVKGAQNVGEAGVWRINSVYLNPDFRKKVAGVNIAEQMLKMVLDEEKKRGAAKVRLWILSKREVPIKLYKKFGFEKLDESESLEIAGDQKYLSEYQIMELDLNEEKLAIKVEIAKPEDWEVYKNIRIEALTKNPEAFGMSLEEVNKRTTEQWQDSLSNEKSFFVLAKTDLSTTGAKSMAGAIKGKEEGTWRLVAVYTRPDFARMGIAEKVCNKVLEEIKNREGTKVFLNVIKNIKQEAARNMYKKLGFRELEDKGDYYIMYKDLVT